MSDPFVQPFNGYPGYTLVRIPHPNGKSTGIVFYGSSQVIGRIAEPLPLDQIFSQALGIIRSHAEMVVINAQTAPTTE